MRNASPRRTAGATAATILFLCVAGAQAQRVSETELLSYAAQWLERNPLAVRYRSNNEASLEIAGVEPIQLDDSQASFYLVRLDPHGYIIMNGDRRLRPVVGFSFSTDADLEPRDDNVLYQLLLIQRRRDAQRTVVPSSASAWDTRPRVRSMTEVDNQLIGPLLATSWAQGNHYNEYCPPVPDASESLDGRAPAGCVAVAFAQVMKYYEWPWRGAGSFSYVDSAGQITGAHTVTLSDPYDWANMQNEYYAYGYEPNEAAQAVSELIYELGVVSETDYETAGSSAVSAVLAGRMPEHFFYEAPIDLGSLDPNQFTDALLGELAEQRPCIASIPGHAIVVDGHMLEGQDHFFHINYGWAGQNDGWYLLDDVNGEAIGSGWAGIRPMLTAIPLASEVTPTSVELRWVVPPTRIAEVETVDVLKRVTVSGTFSDPAEDFNDFAVTSTSDHVDWILSSDGFSGACFHKPAGGYSNRQYHLTATSVLQGGPESVLVFKARYVLLNDRFSVAVSADDGESFTTVWSASDAIEDGWTDVEVPLGAFAGQDILIRFEYTPANFYVSGGVWIDDIAVAPAQWYVWEPIKQVEELQVQHAESTVTFWDPAEDFSAFEVTSTDPSEDWSLSADGFAGSCFYKPGGGYSNVDYDLTSSSSFTPGPNTYLAFKSKYALAENGLAVSVSTNGGATFSEIWRRSDAVHNLWTEIRIPLAAFSGQDVMLRFEYLPGSYYPDKGIWIDDIRLLEVTGSEYGDYPVCYASLADLPEGTSVLAYQIRSAGQVYLRSESFTVTIPANE